MKKIRPILLAFLSIALSNCTIEKHQFPTDKRYWDVNDYDNIVRELRFGYEKDEKLPTFDNPDTRIIVEKLTDPTNFKVVLDDKELGLKHRSEVANDFFREWRDMTEIYNAIDRRDKYIYDKEFIAVWHFGLGLQLRYFNLAVEEMKESADDPNSPKVSSIINSNVNSLIKNYQIYLDEIKNENAFTEEGKVKLAEGIDKYFPQLIELYPNANYNGMKRKSELMVKKSESGKVKNSLTRLIELIDSKEEKSTTNK